MNSRRVFLGQLSPSATSSSIAAALTVYGAIENVDIRESTCGKRKKGGDDEGLNLSFAFVTFKDAEGAQKALNAHVEKNKGGDGSSSTLFRVVEPTRNKENKTKKQSGKGCNDGKCARCEADVNRWTNLLVAEDCTVIALQLPRSHHERMADFISSTFPQPTAKIVEMEMYRRGDEVLLFVSSVDYKQFLSGLSSASFVCRIVKKVYVLGNSENSCSEKRKTGIVRPRPSENWQQDVANEALRLVRLVRQEDEEVACRITSFPPKLAAKLSSDTTLVESNQIELTPKNMTHTISIVQIKSECDITSSPKRNHSGSIGAGTYVITVASVPSHNKGVYWKQAKGDDNAICRAYHKIEETLDRYFGSGEVERAACRKGLVGSVALDCGAAPGGWTQYLSEKVGCRTVYSVDPGELSEPVLQLEGVRHMPIMLDEALAILALEGAHIDVWVSDMCLHEMANQFTWFLAARDRGVLRKGSEEERGCFFVITLKCVRGYSKDAFDAQVREQVLRLDVDIATDVEVMHLFANRSSERTVVGFLK